VSNVYHLNKIISSSASVHVFFLFKAMIVHALNNYLEGIAGKHT